MKLLLLGVAFIVIILTYFIYPIYRAIQISIGIQESAVPYEQSPENPTMKILVAGDSTGVGTGAESPEDSIAGRIGKDFPNASIENISENGITTEELRKKLDELADNNYDLIVIQIGANDVTKFTSKAKVSQEIKLVLDYAAAHASSVILLTAGNMGLSPVFKAPFSNYITSKTLMVREIFQSEAAARSSVKYVDLFKKAEDDTFSTDIDKYYADDNFHPSSEGYGVWYQDIQPLLKYFKITPHKSCNGTL